MNRSFDAIVIGAGQAGPSLTGRLASAGMNVALIEREFVGGTCVNTGCMPTKAMVASAYAAHLVRRAGDYATESWKHSSFGNKILQACEWRERGLPIRIVSEEHWARHL